MRDSVSHPEHYTALGAACSKCGHLIEAIDVTEQFGFSLGNVIKYVWRAGLKGSLLEDLEKASWYLRREIERLSRDGTG